MANLATKAPNFTRENAAAMARRAVESRLAREAREKDEERQRDIEARALAISRESKPDPDDARKNKTLVQIDKLDKMIDKALAIDDREAFLELADAKQKLWKLVQPTAGIAKHSRPRSSPSFSTEDPLATPQDKSGSG